MLQADSDVLPDVRTVWREHLLVGPEKKLMTESLSLRDDDMLVSAASGYYIVEEGESVIFLSKSSSGSSGVQFFNLQQTPTKTTVLL